ncbi:hypothetical protein [Algibacter lectus]|uniref:SGNH/GDSL hydrolase family protein n=1 Tax=Algibacter lectus TaxID=221126 RepID=A0A090VJK9_9FLAO|nr:hypothetical protein [Algibacter lectus]GAL64916.1 hypothetical protein JCM19300_20 [Algibacter lectus]
MKSNIVSYIIKTIILILIISFTFDKVVFLIFNHISDKVFTGQTVGKLNQYLEVKENLDFIVFGSSRANHNVNPIEISTNSFNMGVDGRKLAYSATLIKLLPIKKKQTILLQIDTENAFNESYAGNDIKALSIKYNRNPIIKKEINQLNKSNILQNFYWSLSYNSAILGVLKNYLKPKYNYKIYFGYDPIYTTQNQKKIFSHILKKTKKDVNCINKFKLNKIYANYLTDLTKFCNENNKTLILFTAPKYEDECKSDNEELSKILKNAGINYYDFTDFFNNTDTLENWKDKEHLSAQGAEIFTKRIKELIK